MSITHQRSSRLYPELLAPPPELARHHHFHGVVHPRNAVVALFGLERRPLINANSHVIPSHYPRHQLARA